MSDDRRSFDVQPVGRLVVRTSTLQNLIAAAYGMAEIRAYLNQAPLYLFSRTSMVGIQTDEVRTISDRTDVVARFIGDAFGQNPQRLLHF